MADGMRCQQNWSQSAICSEYDLPKNAEPYAKLARQMALPQTACLALPGPIGPVPGTPNGRAWYSEEDEDESPTVSIILCLLCLVGSVGVIQLLSGRAPHNLYVRKYMHKTYSVKPCHLSCCMFGMLH